MVTADTTTSQAVAMTALAEQNGVIAKSKWKRFAFINHAGGQWPIGTRILITAIRVHRFQQVPMVYFRRSDGAGSLLYETVDRFLRQFQRLAPPTSNNLGVKE